MHRIRGQGESAINQVPKQITSAAADRIANVTRFDSTTIFITCFTNEKKKTPSSRGWRSVD